MVKHSSTVAKVGAKDSIVIAGYVARPMISKNATKELVGGAVAGYAYDLVTQSSGSSSERNGTHVGPGGNTPGVYVPKIAHTIRGGKILTHQCSEGWHPRVHRHKNGDISLVCVPDRYKGKRITFE